MLNKLLLLLLYSENYLYARLAGHAIDYFGELHKDALHY